MPMTIATILIVAAVAANLDAKDVTIRKKATTWQRANAGSVARATSVEQQRQKIRERDAMSVNTRKRLVATIASNGCATTSSNDESCNNNKKRSRAAKKKARTTTSMTILPWRWLLPPKRQRRPVALFLESRARLSSPMTTLMPFSPRRQVFWATVRPFGHLTVRASKKGFGQKLVWSKII